MGEKMDRTWKVTRGLWDGSAKTDGQSGCGSVIKTVDNEKWVTVSEIARPPKKNECSAFGSFKQLG